MTVTERRAPRYEPSTDRELRPQRRPASGRLPVGRNPSRLAPPDILKPGRNCWRVAEAERAALLVDGAAYFRHLDRALRRARRSIMIVGWDFDAATRLCPDRDDETLGDLLRALVEANPELEVRVLVWSFSLFYGPSATLPVLTGEPWRAHPRISLRLDRDHPVYAAHHQKIVCIDDQVAYVGGMDLTVGRWDDCHHAEADCIRCGADGAVYEPVHDVQMAVSGPAAAVVAEVARDRWRRATGEILDAAIGGDAWPGDAADLAAVPVAVSRTMPPRGGEGGVHEGRAMILDALRAARRWVYIEAQYLTAAAIGDALVDSLARPEGPEIVILQTKSSRAPIEHWIMGNNRDRLLRRLWKADRHGRLKAYFPTVPGQAGPCEIKVHSKLILADDRFLRVGSSNLNNRSLGLDSECDLAIEARDDPTRARIRGFRDALLAEHLDVDPARLAETMAAGPSMIGAIEHLNTNGRRLHDFTTIVGPGPDVPVIGTALLDPERPFDLLGTLGLRSQPAMRSGPLPR